MSFYGPTETCTRLALPSQQASAPDFPSGATFQGRGARSTNTQLLEKALSLPVDDGLNALITDEVAFDELPDALPRLQAPHSPIIAPAIR